MSLMDRIAGGLETLGKKANQALDEGRLRMDLLRAFPVDRKSVV